MPRRGLVPGAFIVSLVLEGQSDCRIVSGLKREKASIEEITSRRGELAELPVTLTYLDAAPASCQLLQ